MSQVSGNFESSIDSTFSESWTTPPSFERFSDCLKWHLDAGTRNGVVTGVRWDEREFIEAFHGVTAGEADYSGKIKGWLRRGVLPRLSSIPVIITLLFGSSRDGAYRIWIERLWQRDANTLPDGEVLGEQPALPQAPGKIASASMSASDPSRLDDYPVFVFSDNVPLPNREFFNIAVFSPPQGSTPKSFELLADLSFGTARERLGNFKLEIGLTSALLLDHSTGCAPEPEISSPRPHIVRRARAWRIQSRDNELMVGDQLQGESLARMRHDEQSKVINVVLRAVADEMDFDVRFSEEGDALETKRKAIVRRFIQKITGESLKSSGGRVLLGEAKMSWRVK